MGMGTKKPSEKFEEYLSTKPVGIPIEKSALINNLEKMVRDKDEKHAYCLLESDYSTMRNAGYDGNSFFRAFGFRYLCTREHEAFHDAFQYLNVVDFEALILSPKMKEKYKNLHKNSTLRDFIHRAWEETFQTYLEMFNDYTRALQKFFNQHELVDLVVVMYFRAICLKHFQRNSSRYQTNLSRDSGSFRTNLKSEGKEVDEFAARVMADATEDAIQVIKIKDKRLDIQQFLPATYPKARTFIFLLMQGPVFIILEKRGEVTIVQKISLENLEKKQILRACEESEKAMEIEVENEKQEKEECQKCKDLLEVKVKTCFKCLVREHQLEVEEEEEMTQMADETSPKESYGRGQSVKK